jgi:hypothetical protein
VRTRFHGSPASNNNYLWMSGVAEVIADLKRAKEHPKWKSL